MKRTLIVIGVLALVLAMLLTLAPACGDGDEDVTPTPTPQVKTIDFGFMAPLSGPAAPWGVPAEVGAKWAADKVNAAGGIKVGADRYMINIVSWDTEVTGSVAAEGATKFVYDDGIHFVAGPIITQDAVDPIFTAGKCFYVTLGASGMPSPTSPYRVNAVGDALAWMHAWLKQCVNFHPEVKTIALVNDDTDNGHDFQSATQTAAPTYGLTVVGKEFYEMGTVDFYPILTKLVAENPDAIVTCSPPPGDCALIVKQLREMGYQGWLMFGSGVSTPVLFDVAGRENSWKVAINAPDYTSDIYTAETQALYQEWLTNYAAQGETELQLVVGTGFNAVMFFTQAIEQAGSLDPDEITKVIDDPASRFDTLDAPDVSLGGLQTYGKRGIIPHPCAYGEVIDADNVHLSMSQELLAVP